MTRKEGSEPIVYDVVRDSQEELRDVFVATDDDIPLTDLTGKDESLERLHNVPLNSIRAGEQTGNRAWWTKIITGDNGRRPSRPEDWSDTKRKRIVISASLAALLQPIATSVYTPLLPVIQEDLGATEEEVMATVSSYLFVLGIFPLIWGSVSDAYGRRPIFLFSMVIYAVMGLLCAFSWNIYSLIIFRLLQAMGSSASLTVGAGAIADSHPPAVRGKAMGYYLLGPLVGPVLGPTIGGILSEYLGWRSVFYFLSGLAVLMGILVFFFLPETIAPLPPGTKRPFPKFWRVFLFLRYLPVLSVVALASWAYGGLYAMVASYPRIYTDLYGLGSMQIGLAMMASGVGTLTGSVTGGHLADRACRGGKPAAYRLIPTTIGHWLLSAALTVMGWVITVNLAAAICVSFFVGLCFTLPRSGLTTFAIEHITNREGKASSGSVTGLLYSIMYLIGGASAQFSVSALHEMGYGWFFTMMAIGTVLFTLPVMYFLYRAIAEHRKQKRLGNDEAMVKMTGPVAQVAGSFAVFQSLPNADDDDDEEEEKAEARNTLHQEEDDYDEGGDHQQLMRSS